MRKSSQHIWSNMNIQAQLSPGLGCRKTSVWEMILSVQVLVASARASSSSSPGSSSVLSAWPRFSPVYWSGSTVWSLTALLCAHGADWKSAAAGSLPGQPGWWTDQHPQPTASGPWRASSRSPAVLGGPKALRWPGGFAARSKMPNNNSLTPAACALQQEGEREHLRERQRDEKRLKVIKNKKTKQKNQVTDEFFYFPIVSGPRRYLRPLSSEDAITCVLTWPGSIDAKIKPTAG